MVVSRFSNFSIESPASASALASFEEISINEAARFPRVFPRTYSKAKFQKRFENYRANKCKLTWLLVNCQSCWTSGQLHSRISSKEISRITTMYLGKIEHRGVCQAVKKNILVILNVRGLIQPMKLYGHNFELKPENPSLFILLHIIGRIWVIWLALMNSINSLFKLSDKLNNRHVIVLEILILTGKNMLHKSLMFILIDCWKL